MLIKVFYQANKLFIILRNYMYYVVNEISFNYINYIINISVYFDFSFNFYLVFTSLSAHVYVGYRHKE